MKTDSNILQVNNLSKFFGGLAAVSNCSLKIKKGSITGIIGPNGSGKTTLIKNLLKQGFPLKFSKSACTRKKRKSRFYQGFNFWSNQISSKT